MRNVDKATVEGFGDEWSRMDQTGVSESELSGYFAEYFRIFPWESLPANAVGFDAGCGSGRWAVRAAARVGTLHCVDASERALAVAEAKLREAGVENARFHHASIEDMPLADGSMDFGYSLGVLHHMPDTQAGIAACARKLKPGAPLLLYLYYAFDNKPAWFRAIWKVSDVARRGISRMPHSVRFATSQAIAATVYWPLARTARTLESLGLSVANFPLSAYRNREFYTMRTDALDRFGTRLEQRFTRDQIASMMEEAGLERVSFADGFVQWIAIGYKK